MNRGNLYLKYENKINRNIINEIIDNCLFVKSVLFEDRNVEEVVDNILNLEVEILHKQKHLNNIKEDIMKMNNVKKDIQNYNIDKLRYEGKLKSWLKNMERKDFMKLNSFMDLRKEFNEIDNYMFNKEKTERGRVNLNLNN